MIYTLCYLPKVYWIDEECLFAQVVQTYDEERKEGEEECGGGFK